MSLPVFVVMIDISSHTQNCSRRTKMVFRFCIHPPYSHGKWSTTSHIPCCCILVVHLAFADELAKLQRSGISQCDIIHQNAG